MKHLLTLLITVAVVALFAGPLWAPDEQPEKLGLGGTGVQWDASQQAFVVHYEAQFGIAKAGSQGVFTINTRLEIRDVTGDIVGLRECAFAIFGEGADPAPPGGALVPLEAHIQPWDRNGGTVSGEVYVTLTAQLLNPSGRNVGSAIIQTGISVIVGPPPIGGGGG